MATIREISDRVGFRGNPAHRTASPSDIRTLPVIDNSNRYASNVRTSIDCYVSGQYVQRNGRVLEVTQRYTIFIAYNRETQNATLQQLRDRVMMDFHERYGQFNISTVYVPDLPVPKQTVVPGVRPGEAAPMEFYHGSEMFRGMTRYERMRFESGTEREKAELNIRSVRKRYGYR